MCAIHSTLNRKDILRGQLLSSNKEPCDTTGTWTQLQKISISLNFYIHSIWLDMMTEVRFEFSPEVYATTANRQDKPAPPHCFACGCKYELCKQSTWCLDDKKVKMIKGHLSTKWLIIWWQVRCLASKWSASRWVHLHQTPLQNVSI